MAEKKDADKASEDTPKLETAATMAAPGDEHDANKTEQPGPEEGDGAAEFKLPHKMDLITIPGNKDDGSDAIQVSGRRWVELSAENAKKVREYAKSRRIMLRERPVEKKGS